jgi:CRP-like cAMP-binding protein
MVKENLLAKHEDILAKYGLGGLDYSEICVLRYQSQEFIIQQGYACPYILIVLDGRMKVFNTASNGRTLLFCFNEAEGIMGEMEFAMNLETAASSVQAMTEVTCIGIPRARYQKELKSNPVFMNAVSTALAQKMFHSTNNSAINILQSLDARLCAYIAMTSINGYFKEKLTDIAELLGTSYRHLLRTLDNLCRQGILEKTRQGYFIKDQAALKKKGGDCYLL